MKLGNIAYEYYCSANMESVRFETHSEHCENLPERARSLVHESLEVGTDISVFYRS